MKWSFAAVALLAFAAVPAFAEGTLGPNDFAKAVVGNSILGKGSQNKNYGIYFKEDGTMTFQRTDGWTDQGRWRVEGSKFCQKWNVIRDAKDFCLRDFQHEGGKWSMFNELLKERQEIEVKPGHVSIF